MESASALPRRDDAVGIWLLAIAFLVVAMILVGGATRVTDSGLSITEWDLGKGLNPPLNAVRWTEEFALYQHTTEYQVQNRGMSLAEFQTIYWWEWGHRFLGKIIGLAFAIPFAIFWATGRLSGRFWPVLALFALGGLQGFVGWWMVTSGLFSSLDVSPIRLAIHLALALIVLAGALWLAMEAFAWPRQRCVLGAPAWTPPALLALIFVQAMFGALMAGANGGPAFADWPTIGGEWVPDTAFSLEPFWRNFTEHHASQHLLHRSLGYGVALSTLAIGVAAMLKGQGLARGLAMRLGVLGLIQVALGIGTLLSAAAGPHWALAHQFTAALLWIGAVGLARVTGRNTIPSR